MKEINTSKLNTKLRQSLEGEISILRRVKHENIVQLHDVLQVRGYPTVRFSQICWGGMKIATVLSGQANIRKVVGFVFGGVLSEKDILR